MKISTRTFSILLIPIAGLVSLGKPSSTATQGKGSRASHIAADWSHRASENTSGNTDSSLRRAGLFAPPSPDETIQVFASDCVTPQFDFNIGQTVCAKISGALLASPAKRRFLWANPCGFAEQIGPDVTTDPQTNTFTLPATDTAPAGPCDARGTWSVNDSWIEDAGQEATALFVVHDPMNPAVDLSVRKFAVGGGGNFDSGANVTYQVLVRNAGPDSAMNVSLTDAVPANTTFVSETHPGGWTCSDPAVGGTGTITCTIGSLAGDPMNSNPPATFTFVFNINPATATGTTISNTATISSGTLDLHMADNSSTDRSVTVVLVCRVVIACPANIMRFVDSGQFTATVNPGMPAVLDSCGFATSENGVRSDGKSLNAPYPIGVTLITWTATDSNGNTASCTQTVTVMVPSDTHRRRIIP